MLDLARTVRILLARPIRLAVCSALLLAACSSGGAGDLEGKYFYALQGSSGDGMTLDLRKDGIVVATRPGGKVQDGTYRVEGTKVTVSLTGDGANLVYTREADGNLTTLFYGSEKAVFVRQ
jgi:hypothetical protein